MTLDQLRYFQAAAKFEHVGKAARSFPISPSVISSAVKGLEEEFGCELFVRDNKRIRLTAHGHRLLELAGNLLAQADGLSQALGKKENPLTGHYRVGASHFLSAKLLTPVFAELQSRSPGITVDLYSQSTWQIVDSVLAGRLDFGIGFSPLPNPQLDLEQISEGSSLVVVRKDHPIFKHPAKKAYEALPDYPATMHMATDKIFMVRHHPFLKEAHLDRNIRFSFDSDFVAVENLKGSDHWSLLLDLVVAEFQKDLWVVPFPKKSGAGYTVQIIRHKTRKVDPAMLAAFELIREKVRHLKKAEA